MTPEILTPQEAAEKLKISKKALHRLAKSGQIAFIQIDGKSRRFTSSAIDEFIALRTVPPQIDKKPPRGVSSPPKEVKSAGELDRRSRLMEMRKW